MSIFFLFFLSLPSALLGVAFPDTARGRSCCLFLSVLVRFVVTFFHLARYQSRQLSAAAIVDATAADTLTAPD